MASSSSGSSSNMLRDFIGTSNNKENQKPVKKSSLPTVQSNLTRFGFSTGQASASSLGQFLNGLNLLPTVATPPKLFKAK